MVKLVKKVRFVDLVKEIKVYHNQKVCHFDDDILSTLSLVFHACHQSFDKIFTLHWSSKFINKPIIINKYPIN